MQRLRDNKAVSMVAPNRNFITDQLVTLTSLNTKMTKCFSQLVSKQYIHNYITCRLCKETVAGTINKMYLTQLTTRSAGWSAVGRLAQARSALLASPSCAQYEVSTTLSW